MAEVQPDPPYCFLGWETCQAILTSYRYRFRARTYVDEEVPGALLIAFSPAGEKTPLFRLEQLQLLTQQVQRADFARHPY